jgi:hypothetical protein
MNVYDQQKPFQSNQERLVSEALASSQLPAEVISAIRPPLPQVDPFRPRFGYKPVQDRALTIEDVVGVSTTYGDARYQTSGGMESIQGSSRSVQSNIGF